MSFIEAINGEVAWLRVVKNEKYGFGEVLIPPGTFMMGSPESEKNRESDEVQHGDIDEGFFYDGVFGDTGNYGSRYVENPRSF